MYSMVTVWPTVGTAPLPSDRVVLATPIVKENAVFSCELEFSTCVELEEWRGLAGRTGEK